MLKGRKFLSIFILGIASFLLLLSVSIPISFKTRASVPFTLGKTMEQFSKSTQLRKWFLPFANLDTAGLSISQLPLAAIKSKESEVTVLSAKPGNVYLSFSDDGEERDYRFIVTRDQRKTNTCVVTMTISNTLWKRMIDPDPIDNRVIESIRNLEKFTGSTTLFYGLPLSTQKITDSCFLYLSTMAKPDEKAQKTKLLFDSLFQFAKRKKIMHSGKRIFSSQAFDSSELRLFAGIAIVADPVTVLASGMTLKKLKRGESMLVAEFKGPYKNIHTAYKALEQYRRDYQITGSEIPFEEFNTPGYGYLPDDSVSVKVCYPVY